MTRGTRAKIIEETTRAFRVTERDDEFTLDVGDAGFGDALFDFVQVLLKISDVSFLTRERVQSTFAEDFRSLLTQEASAQHRVSDWTDRRRDPEGFYAVDCRIETESIPVFVFALQSDDKVRDATITLHQFQRWGERSFSIGIFEAQETVGRRPLAQFSDVADKQFSNLGGNLDRIGEYLHETVEVAQA